MNFKFYFTKSLKVIYLNLVNFLNIINTNIINNIINDNK